MYAKKIPSDCYNEGIRCILKQIREYTKPESLWHWCAEVKPSDVKADNFYSGLRYRLSVMEYLKAYTLIEKVQLIFIFGRPIKADFVKMLTDAKCTVQLDEKGRIIYFCSEDGTVVRESDHKKNEKRFKQELLGPHSEIIPENAKRSAIKRYSKPPGNVHYWKSEPHFEHSYFEHQNAPFDGRINYDELDVKPVIFGNRCLQNSIDAKRMKIEEPEDPFADFSTDFSATSSRNIQAREAQYYVMEVSDEEVAFTVIEDGRIFIYDAPGVSQETLNKWDPAKELFIFPGDLNEKTNGNGRNQKMGAKDSKNISIFKRSHENPDVYFQMDIKMSKEEALFTALLKLINRKESYEWVMANRRIPEEHEFHVSRTIRVLKERVEFLKDSEEEVQSSRERNHWIFSYLWLLVLFIPVICYFGAPIFDVIVRYFTDFFLNE